MRFARWIVVVTLVSCTPAPRPDAPSAAETVGSSVCLDSAMTTQAMRECMSATLESANRQLAQLLDSARRTVASPAAVDSAQAAWLIYRSAQCHAESAEVAGGTMESLAALGCHESLALDRIKVLQSQLGALIR